MATITPTITIPSATNVPVITWTGITTTTDTPAASSVAGQRGLAGAVQFAGTFAGGSTATLKGSVDGTTYTTLKDVFGNDISCTAAALFEFTTSCPYIKPNVVSGAGDNVDVIVCFRG